MKKLRILVIIVFVISAILFGVYTIRDKALRDVNAPVIQFEEDEISVSLDATEEELLSDVSATDKEDGDLTSYVRVASISRMMSGGKRLVKYIVFDGANNLGTAERVVKCKDYSQPKIYMKAPFRVYENDANGENLIGALSAVDEMTGEEITNLAISIEEGTISGIGTYHITFRATNSLDDTRSIQVEWVVLDSTDTAEQGKYYPELTQYILYTSKDETVDFASYLTGIVNTSERFVFGAANTPANITSDKVVIDSSAVDYSTPGQYAVHYSYTTRTGATGVTTAYVIVEGE